MEPVIHLREVVCLLGRFPALAGASLDVAPSEILLVQGPNGAGKSTLLRLCAGLLDLATGHGTVFGHDLRHERHLIRGRVGLLGHQAGLYDDLTVRDNVRFWTRAGGSDLAGVEEALDQVDMGAARAEIPAARLSAGQRRRTALAVLLARRPELWLLDEPHAGLDQDGRALVDRIISQAVLAGATVVMSSHDIERAEALAHRSVTIMGGVVLPDHQKPVPQHPHQPPVSPSSVVAADAPATAEADHVS